MKSTGARMAVKALEDEGVRFTFGIPGTHNLELYDVLEASDRITPILVTDEQSASFMADAVSRTSSHIGVVNLVPGAGVTHALSGIAEAFMDNIPMLVLTCGVRTDTGKAYQLHDIDQLAVLTPVTKATLKSGSGSEVYDIIRKAIRLARSGAPGPVAVEIPVNHYLFPEEIEQSSGHLPERLEDEADEMPRPRRGEVERVAEVLNRARCPAIYVGNGARGAIGPLLEVAEKCVAPVATTIQGKGVFPEHHPLWLWNGFGRSAPAFVRHIMDRCDCLLAIGCRFGEVATASYGLEPPANLIHVDIDAEVFHRNYPAKIAVESDAATFLRELLPHLRPDRAEKGMEKEIAEGHKKVREAWLEDKRGDRVSPVVFFEALQRVAGAQAIYTTDSGNGTFLAMEHLRLDGPERFVGPIDYSCMGYAVPAAIAAKLANPEKNVVGLAGDGALLMTGLELLTAAAYHIAPVIFVLRDGELAQISHFQRLSVGRESCTRLPDYSTRKFAEAVECRYFRMGSDKDVEATMAEVFSATGEGEPVLVEVAIDYRTMTYFTKGVLATNFWRLPWKERVRKVARLAGRKLGR